MILDMMKVKNLIALSMLGVDVIVVIVMEVSLVTNSAAHIYDMVDCWWF